MKRLLLTLCCTLATALFADTWTDPETNITWTYTLSNGNASLGGGFNYDGWFNYPAIPTPYAGSLTIPATLNGSPVVALNNYAFSDCSALTSVVIPEGVTSIGGSAFRNCSALTSVVIPEGVTAIGNHAFFGCSALTSVEIPEGVTSIGDYTFEYCSSLTSVVIPSSVTVIGLRAFADCSSLTSVVIPEGVTAIGDAFQGCSSLTSVVIPASVTAIGGYAFSGCSALTSVDIPEGVTTIGERAFTGCFALRSVVIPEGVTTIGVWAFSSCSALTSVVIPASVTTIGERAFDCSALRSVTFLGDVPEGWENVYPSAGRKIHFSQAYAGKWNAVLSAAQRGTLVDLISKAGVTASAEMTTPKTMRVTYSVESTQPTAKVRAVAWKDGVRSFANIVPVKTVAEGSPEAVPNGGAVATGVEHTFLWQISADWATDLDKVVLEILVAEGTLLPQEKITIPTLGEHPAMTLTRNRLTTWQLFDALVWCYAEGDDTLTVTDGVVKVNGTAIANGTRVPDSGDWDGGYSWSTAWKSNATALLNYLYGKMGYRVLAGEDLAWAKTATRLELADSGLDQVSVKIAEE